MFRILMKREGV